MNKFAITVPDWNAIPPAKLNKNPQLFDQKYLILDTQNGEIYCCITEFGLRISTMAPSQQKTINDKFHILKVQPSPLVLEFSQDEALTTISALQYKVEFAHETLAFKCFYQDHLIQQSASDGHFVREHRLAPFAKTAQGWLINLELGHSESVYGLGEKWSKLDKRGQLIRSYNHDALGVNTEQSYKNTPFAWSLQNWSLFVHTHASVTHGVGYAPWSQRAYCLLIEDPQMDVFISHCDSPQAALHQYCQMTGFAPTPPDWSLGVILSKAYYKDAQELLSVAKEVRRQGMPCDVITLDGRAWQDTDTRFAFEWDPKRYADPQPIIAQLKAMNFKICVWEYPMISVRNPLFEKAAQNGWLIKDKRNGEAFRYEWDLSPFGEVLTPLPESGILDFTHPEAYDFWLHSHQPLFELGVDMIKADFGEQIENENMLSYSGLSGSRLHNVYTLLYNRCVYEAAEKYCQTGPFLFSRSAWTGSQCYPAQWGGDPQADWQGLAASIRGALSWGMSGGPFFATDIGGFYKDKRDAELYVRWAQASIFSAHMRLHGIGAREPWSYGETAGKAVFEALKLRYRLLPYLKACVKQASETGLPVQRAMALAFPEQPLSHCFEEQFMCGDDLLVVPCVVPGGRIKFYLPQGKWRRFPDNTPYQGHQYYEESLPLDHMAVFVKEGTSLALGETIEHTEMPQDISDLWRAES